MPLSLNRFLSNSNVVAMLNYLEGSVKPWMCRKTAKAVAGSFSSGVPLLVEVIQIVKLALMYHAGKIQLSLKWAN